MGLADPDDSSQAVDDEIDVGLKLELRVWMVVYSLRVKAIRVRE